MIMCMQAPKVNKFRQSNESKNTQKIAKASRQQLVSRKGVGYEVALNLMQISFD